MKQSKIYELDKDTKEAYLLEKALAKQLKEATREERKKLYNVVYAEYYDKYPQHPFIVRNEDAVKQSTLLQMNYLKGFLRPDVVFLEVGPGTGALSVEVANHVKTVYVVDVSGSPLKSVRLPANVKVVISNGINIPASIGAVNLAYSNQVIEHLHPDDALEQVRDIYNVLDFGGSYICRTPHRYSGPHDISVHFDRVATCFHLKEYTVRELTLLFKLAGFRKVTYEITPKGMRLRLPLFIVKAVESLLAILPFALRRAFAKNLPIKPLFNFSVVGTK